MNRFSKIATFDHEIEAQIMEEVLKERKIPHFIESYFDKAYGGLFQFQKGWGAVHAPEKFAGEIREVLSEIRNQQNTTKDD